MLHLPIIFIKSSALLAYAAPAVSDKSFSIPFRLAGGDNPALVFVMIGLFCLLILNILFYIGFQMFKAYKFGKICDQVGLESQEVGTIKSFITRFHYPNPLFLLVRRSYFDGFMNQVAHYFYTSRMGEKELYIESQGFAKVREKLGFAHSYDEKVLQSSRGLLKNFAIQVHFRDKNLDYTFTFSAKIVENYEFFLLIEPPEDEDMRKFILRKPKAPFDIQFVRENDSEYFFNSYLIRPSTIFDTRWLIQHSSRLIKGDPQKAIHITLSILCGGVQEFDVKESEGQITLLTKKEVHFRIDDQESSLTKGTTVLMSFDLLGTPISFHGSIAKILGKGGKQLFIMPLKGVDEGTKLLITRFLQQQKAEEEKEQEASKQQ